MSELTAQPTYSNLINIIGQQRAEIARLMDKINQDRRYIQRIQTDFQLIKVITDTHATKQDYPCSLPSHSSQNSSSN